MVSPPPSISEAAAPLREERILLFAPPDTPVAAWAADVLHSAHLRCLVFEDLSSLVQALQEGGDTIIVAERAITERAARLLSAAMAKRAPWSNLPIVILTDGTPEPIHRLKELSLFGPAASSNITILERPMHEVTLTTVVRSALRARQRQYEVRDLMHHLETKNEELRKSQNALQNTNATLEERVAKRTKQVRELALALTTAEQRERARISEVLHDHLQQLIHGARIWTESMVDNVGSVRSATLRRIIDLLDEATKTTRSLTVELSPPVLQNEGLAEALHWLTTHVAKAHDLHVVLDVDSDLYVAEQDLRSLLFRMIRELLFNVVKHAGVDTAAVRAHRTRGNCVIEVIDEGVGFEPDHLDENDPNDSFGLFSVRERLDLVGGHLTLDTAPEEGTTARIEVPLEKDVA